MMLKRRKGGVKRKGEGREEEGGESRRVVERERSGKERREKWRDDGREGESWGGGGIKVETFCLVVFL